jgi:hypothetical protein
MSEEETNKEEMKEQELVEAGGYAGNGVSHNVDEVLPWYRRLRRKCSWKKVCSVCVWVVVGILVLAMLAVCPVVAILISKHIGP